MELIERIGVNTPPAEEYAETNGLKHASKCADSDRVEWTFFGKHLRYKLYK